MLEMPRDSFLRIHLRSVARELLKANPANTTGTEEPLCLAAPVDRCTIPGAEKPARDMAQEVAEEGHDFGTPDRMAVHPEVEPLVAQLIAGRTPAADGAYWGEMIVREPVVENLCPSPREHS